MKLTEFMQTDTYMNYLTVLDSFIPEPIDKRGKLYDVVIDLLSE